MPFRLMGLLTDWDKDKVGEDSTCGSMSFCGARDRYPDSRGMGYPFDRPFSNGQSILQTIRAHNNMAARDIKIHDGQNNKIIVLIHSLFQVKTGKGTGRSKNVKILFEWFLKS